MTLEGWQKSAEHFERAVAADGGYTLAHAALADADALAGERRASGSPIARSSAAGGSNGGQARSALDRGSCLPRTSAGLLRVGLDGGGPVVQARHRADAEPIGRASRYGLCLASQGSTDEAVAETRRALQLDPVNLFNNFAVGWALIGARRYDEVIEHFKQSLEIDPHFVAAHHFIGLGYVGKRMFREGIAEIEQATALSTDNLVVLANLGFAYAAAGDKIRAERILEDLQQAAVSRYVSPYYLATILAGLGRTDQAFEQLERAYADRSRRLWALKVAPQWDWLRTDPRFEDLMRRVRLAD